MGQRGEGEDTRKGEGDKDITQGEPVYTSEVITNIHS